MTSRPAASASRRPRRLMRPWAASTITWSRAVPLFEFREQIERWGMHAGLAVCHDVHHHVAAGVDSLGDELAHLFVDLVGIACRAVRPADVDSGRRHAIGEEVVD